MRTCDVLRLGLVPYQEAWELQNQLADEIVQGRRQAVLMLLEHPHTYTFGRSGDEANLLWNLEQLDKKSVETHWVDRGGDVTYHGPGQLVAYPIIQLDVQDEIVVLEDERVRIPKRDYVGYLRRLENVIIQVLKIYEIQGYVREGLTGVWVEGADGIPAKIAAIGVKVDVHGITRHGFALNVAPDMTYWEGIIGCGLHNAEETCMKELIPEPPAMMSLMEVVETNFGLEFGFEMHGVL